MSQLTGTLNATGQSLYSSSANPQHFLGEEISSNDGRRFRYAKVGATALVPGKLYQNVAETTAIEDLTPAAAAIGDTTITITSSVTLTANQLAGGYAVITVTPGQGYQYKIKSNPAVTSAGVTITLEDPINIALTTSSRVDLIPSQYASIVVNPTSATGSVVGAAVYPVAAGEYGWIQVSGPCALLADGAITVGTNVIASNAVAGAVEPGADAADLQAYVGSAITGIADTQYGLINLHLA